MTILEKKVDLLLRLSLTNDPREQERYKNKLCQLLSGKESVGTVREETAALLTELGMPQILLGYAYTLEAICITVEKPEMAVHGNITKLKAEIAALFDTTMSRADRAIRHAIDRCFDNCDPDLSYRYFGGTVSADKGKLALGDFIAGCARIIRERLRGGE